MRKKEHGKEDETEALINESGVYALVLTAPKPECQEFRKWVTSEVLPQIRKTGYYAADEKANNNPIFGLINSAEEQFPRDN